MGFLTFLTGLFVPVTKIIEKIPTETERMKLTNELADIQSQIQFKVMEYETKVLELQADLSKAQAEMVKAEAASESWFVRHYKPIIVFGLFIMIVLDTFGITTHRLPELFITVFSSAFGIVTVGPVIGKVGSSVMDKFTGKKNE